MDEFNRVAWERDRAINRYPRVAPTGYQADPPRWTVGNIIGGLLMVSIGGFLIWGTWDDLAEHVKPARPVPAQEEQAPDVLGQIRKLEQSISEVKRLQYEIEQAGAEIRRMLDKHKATAQAQQP